MPMILPATLFEDNVFRLRAGLLGSPQLWDKQSKRLVKLRGPASHFLAKLLDLARKKHGMGFVDAPQVRGALYGFCNEMAAHPTRAQIFLASTDPAEFFGRAYHG